MKKTLNIKTFKAEKPSKLPPALLLHGGYADSSCWMPNFVPYLTGKGVDCTVLDFAGHGHSGGKMDLNTFGLDDYAANVAEAVEKMGEPPVLVGHSMGALVAEIYAETGTAKGLAMLAPVPPTGTSRSAFFINMFNPGFIAAVGRMLAKHPTEADQELLSKLYFSQHTPREAAAAFFTHMQPESNRAVMEMAMLPLRLNFGPTRYPALVLGGEDDTVFPSWTLAWTALPWNTTPVVIPQTGHMMMLDAGWKDAADAVLAFMKGLK